MKKYLKCAAFCLFMAVAAWGAARTLPAEAVLLLGFTLPYGLFALGLHKR